MNVTPGAMRRETGRLFAYGFSFTVLISGFTGYAQTSQKNDAGPHSETAIMQEMLAEVRQLRRAVERVAAVDVRVQLTLQQMQLEQQQLNRASSRLEEVRKQIADLSSQQADFASRLQGTEARLGQEQDPRLVAQLRQEQDGLKEMTERFPAREARLRAQEADAATSLQIEQNKWQELSDQLSALTQTLGVDSTGGADGKRP